MVKGIVEGIILVEGSLEGFIKGFIEGFIEGFAIGGGIILRDPRQALRDITTGLLDGLKTLILIALALKLKY
jgi:hypothetical protein